MLLILCLENVYKVIGYLFEYSFANKLHSYDLWLLQNSLLIQYVTLYQPLQCFEHGHEKHFSIKIDPILF